MLFNTYEFLFVFLPLILILYYLAVGSQLPRVACFVLFIGSCLFYAWWDYHYLPLLLTSIAFNYFCGTQIDSSETETKRKRVLVIGILINLTALFFYKYLAFFMSILFPWTHYAPIKMTLPLGISFFTFTQIAFLVDAYHRKIEKLTPVSYGLFVTIFPHLIAGPILHHKEMMQQFNNSQTFGFNYDNIGKGIFLFSLGLCKKLLIADTMAPIAKNLFDATHTNLSILDAWYGSLAYTLQLYFDFSGYSDMAVGLGLLFNLILPQNFNSPYKATSIIEFWKRWHITLSQFLRDYVYIPLGGNRNGELLRYRNLFLTMLIGGVWHGAGWTFIIWGALHGLFLTINHFWQKVGVPLPKAFSWIITFLAVVIGWVFFRSSDLSSAVTIVEAMFGLNNAIYHTNTVFSTAKIIQFGMYMLMALALPNSNEWTARFRPSKRWGFASALLLGTSILYFDRVCGFLYYQF